MADDSTRINIDSEGDDNQNVGVNYGTLIKNLVLQIKQEKPRALKTLPRDIADFVGRSQPIADIETSLQTESAIAISAMSGMGGVGKSALAIHVAHRLGKQRLDAQLYVNLLGTTGKLALQPADVIRDFLRKFGLEDRQIAAMSVTVQRDFYRSVLADLDAVLVLDNARDAAQVEPLLPGQGNCAVLLTSREAIGLRGAASLRLGVMEPDEAYELLLKVSGRSGLSETEVRIARQVVELCGRLPLALRIAGAILQKRSQWSWENLCVKLRDERQRLAEFARLHQIVQPEEDLDVQSSLNVSYRLLELPQQQLMAQLAAIPGQDFGVAVAAAVTEDEAIDETLDRLCDLQLLDGRTGGRYQFHDLVRLFGQEKLEEKELEQLGLRAVSWYLGSADTANDSLLRQVPDEILGHFQEPSESLEDVKQRWLDNSLAWFEQEWENLKLIVAWSSQKHYWDLTVKLPQLMDAFAMLQGYRGDQPPLYQLALDAAIQNDDRLGKANTLQAIGDVLQFLKRSDEALSRYDEALKLYEKVGAQLGKANTLQAIGDVLQFLDRRDEALSRYDEALKLYEKVGDQLGKANTLKAIGIQLSQQGNYRQAVPLVEEALAIYRNIGDRYSQANALQNLAVLYQNTGRVKEGFACGQEASQIFIDLGLLSHAMPKWIQSVIKFAKRTKLHLIACVLAGIFAFPFALIFLVLISVWRLVFGRFRR